MHFTLIPRKTPHKSIKHDFPYVSLHRSGNFFFGAPTQKTFGIESKRFVEIYTSGTLLAFRFLDRFSENCQALSRDREGKSFQFSARRSIKCIPMKTGKYPLTVDGEYLVIDTNSPYVAQK